MHAVAAGDGEHGSPVSNDGRGLKRLGLRLSRRSCLGSPVSNDGRGLKLHDVEAVPTIFAVRPSAMTGVD